MPILNNSISNPFNAPQPQLNSSDRTAHLKSKTKYAAAVNLAKNGGTLKKTDGSQYVGTVQTTSSTMTSASSYADLLDVTKGKYLLTPPPSSNLTSSFQPSTGDVYYGNFAVTNYTNANIPVTVLGFPTVVNNDTYAYPNQLVYSSTSAGPSLVPTSFNNSNLVVDPDCRVFYSRGTCDTRNYFKNVRIDATVDVSITIGGVVVQSSRPYNEQQAQRIIAHQAQSLRGFQFPTRVHLDLDNCDSKPSITPTAPDAPVIYVSSRNGNTVTISWLYAFDGGSPITAYTVYVNGTLVAQVAPQPCLNTYTFTVTPPADIWITASNCVPNATSGCTTLTSGQSNRVAVG